MKMIVIFLTLYICISVSTVTGGTRQALSITKGKIGQLYFKYTI